MILRNLSPAKPGCINDFHSIFEALREGQCALGPLKSLVGNHPGSEMLSSVGGIAGKLALNIGGEGVMVVRRSILPAASAGLRQFPVLGSKLNRQLLSGNYDLPGGVIEPDDRTPMAGLFREAQEEGLEGLPTLNKTIMLGCYARATTKGVQAVIRLGVAAALNDLPTPDLSYEHTASRVLSPRNPSFPSQWQELGDTAMTLVA